MAILRNCRHERFAQELANGKSATEAYALAGYSPHDGNAARLRGNERIKARVEQILESAALRVEITQARIMDELGKIAFSDIRRITNWYSQVNIAQVDSDADAEALVDEGEVRFAVANQVELISSDDIDENTAAAIREVSMTDKGSLSVKLHDKRGALGDLGRALGMFTDRTELSGPGGGPIEAITEIRETIVDPRPADG